MALKRLLLVGLRTLLMSIYCGARPVIRIWMKPASLLKQSTVTIPIRCWPTTVHLRSTEKKHLSDATISNFQNELGAMGYKFQFVTLAGFHSLNYSMFNLANDYREHGMAAYSRLQEAEFASEEVGYSATRHQREVGTGYFDAVRSVLTGDRASTSAMADSTETAQFH